jgi:uncharacterized protein (DUF488 family)
MLNRQKSLLMILRNIGGVASPLKTMRLAFLLSHETPSRGGKTFYKFIPYQCEPYSFSLNQEIKLLIRNGFLEKEKIDSLTLSNLSNALNIALPTSISTDIDRISRIYGELCEEKLMHLIHKKYPWLLRNSKDTYKDKEKNSLGANFIYTAGYEGKTIDEFLNLLLQSGISQLIDVRYNPVSRRYGFHKSTLLSLCSSLGIDYHHLPGLGIPGTEREHLGFNHQYHTLFETYRRSLPSREKDLSVLSDLLRFTPSALMCMEADPSLCHRSVLAEYLSDMIKLPVKHLGHST